MYLVYNKRSLISSAVKGVSSDDDNNDRTNKNYTYDLITSIGYSRNPLGVVGTYNPYSAQYEKVYEGGAIFIGTVHYSNRTLNTGNCFSGQFNAHGAHKENRATYGSTCPGSIELFDICQGTTDPFIVDEVDGPVYAMNVDVNMNVITQNGQGGLSLFSVAYTPGVPTAVSFLESQASTCGASAKDIFADIMLGLALLVGAVAAIGLAVVCPECYAAGAFVFETTSLAATFAWLGAVSVGLAMIGTIAQYS